MNKNTKLVGKALNLAKHLQVKWLELAVLAVILAEFLFPQITLAQQLNEPDYRVNSVLLEDRLVNSEDYAVSTEPGSLPVAAKKEPKKVIWVTITAYSSDVAQTDSTPCITANGFNVCENNEENVVAANFLSFGTNVKMPELFGDQVLIVQDRMNARHTNRIDVWMKSREAAIKFGKKYAQVEIY